MATAFPRVNQAELKEFGNKQSKGDRQVDQQQMSPQGDRLVPS